MKKRNIKKFVSLFLYIFSIIVMWLPIYQIEGKNYTFYSGYLYMSGSGIKGKFIDEILTLNGGKMALKIGVIVMFLYLIASAFYILSVLLKKNWHLNILSLFFAFLFMFICLDTMSQILDNILGLVALAVPAFLCAVELLFIKMIDVWDESLKAANESMEKEQRRKEEEKRRLYFPGKYPKEFYRITWKNFKYDLREYVLLLGCSSVIATVSFSGIACYQMMTNIHRAENFLIGQGLGRILWNAMIPITICAMCLMVYIMIFYLQRWMESYSLFRTLGIRKKALYTILLLEILFCFLCSVLCGMVTGNILVILLKQLMHHVLGTHVMLENVTGKTYLLMFLVMIFVYVAAIMASRDILQEFNLNYLSNRRIQREKHPEKGLKIRVTIGGGLIIASICLYAQLVRHESIYLLAMCFMGCFLVVRYGGAIYLKNEKKGKNYLKNLMNHNQLYYKSKTTAWYLIVLIILYTYTMFYCSFQIISAKIAEKPETLFPYNYVCIADSNDDGFFDKIKKKYGAEILSYPMVRVANVDKTERMEGRGERRAQGQQIGISETTYHKLKKNIVKNYETRNLQLDKDGEKVYVVHQQDRSIKAQPIDWTYGSRKPFLHIGLPCANYVPESPSKAYAQRKIAGEEIGSLIGCFRQGVLENIVVFSDEYFKKAEGMWKYTNIYTGNFIKNKKERIEGVTIYQGPTQLVLLNVDEKDYKAIEKEMKSFEKHHTYEKQFDGEVSCYYSKKAAVFDMKTERIMKQIVNILIVVVVMMTSMFLLYVKVTSELKEKKERARFLRCMGMQRKERIRMLKKEISLFYWLPTLSAICLTLCFTIVTFRARMYSQKIALEYIKNAVWLWSGWIIIQRIFVWILTKWYVRKVEGKDER